MLFVACAPLGCDDSSNHTPDAGIPNDAGADLAVVNDLHAGEQTDGGDVDGGPVATTTEFAYVAHSLYGGIAALAITPGSGAPVPVPGSPVDSAVDFYSIARHPSGRLVYAADHGKNHVYGYRVGDNGALTALKGSPFAISGAPNTIAIDPLGRFAYVGDGAIAVYRIDASSGALTEVAGSPFAAAVGPAFLLAEPSGRFVYATGTGGIHAFAVDDKSGALKEIDKSPFGGPAVSHGGLCVHPNGKLLYGGSLHGFTIDVDTGALALVPGSPFADVAGSDLEAIHVAMDPHGRFVYGVKTENGTVAAMAIDAQSGVLTAVPGSPFKAGPAPFSIAVDGQGRFILVGNDDNDIVTVLSSDAATGALKPVDGSPFHVSGLQPQIVTVSIEK
jgi:6-phosphogluconolactonase (cycloisomerase 2 family)